MTLVQQLLHLQNMDHEWDEKYDRYQAVRQGIADQNELNAHRATKVAADEALSATRGKLHSMELEMASLQTRAQELQEELYGGGVLAARELDNLRKDHEHTLARLAVLEDDILLAMTRVDDLQETAAAASAKLVAYEASYAQEHETLIDEYKVLRARLEQLKNERQRQRAALPPRDVALYDELRAAKGGRAMAPVADGICQRCRVSVPAHKVAVAKRGDAVARCEGCGRILYQG